MTLDNEQIVRKAYQIAEDQDLEGWVAAFTDDGTFTDNSIGVTFRGPDRLPEQVENYARAFPDMHRELCRREDQALRLLPRGLGHPHPARRYRQPQFRARVAP
jgi:ketosteroid isomerase-like protein